jgi:hypothetical protein
VNEANDGTQALTTQFSQIVSEDDSTSLYNSLAVGGGTTDSGCSLMSSNSISLFHRNLSHHIEVTANRNNISDVNGLVFSYNENEIFIKDFMNAHNVTIPWDSYFFLKTKERC